MHLTPNEIYQSLAIVLPLGVCCWKWKYAKTWFVSALMFAAVSWVSFIYGDSGRHDLIRGVHAWTGWFWMLPIFTLLAGLFKLIEHWVSPCLREKWGSFGYYLCVAVTALVLLWNWGGRMSESRALLEARRVIERQELEAIGPVLPEYSDGIWTIRYPSSDFKRIELGRNGELLGIGG